MNRFIYPVDLEQDEAGFWLATFPDVPEAGTDAPSVEEAVAEAQDALVAALAGYVQARRRIPMPSKRGSRQAVVFLPPLTAAKLALYQSMLDQGISNVGLARRLGVSEAAVRRLVHPDHASRIEKVEAALERLGKRLVVEAAPADAA